MNFDKRRSLLFSVFDGEDDEGYPFGVYVQRTSEIGENIARYKYLINARFFAVSLILIPIIKAVPEREVAVAKGKTNEMVKLEKLTIKRRQTTFTFK